MRRVGWGWGLQPEGASVCGAGLRTLLHSPTVAATWSRTLLLVAVLLILAARFFAPSNLFERDQPRTVAYTADVVVNGRWVLPRDELGRLATKPPMYNWIGAAAVKAVNRWDEWVLRLPSWLAGLATVGLVWWLAGSVARGYQGDLSSGLGPAIFVAAIGPVAALSWIANHLSVRIIYEARPNMLLVAFMTGGWALATTIMQSSQQGPPRDAAGRLRNLAAAAGLWLCVAAAALSKGPPALLVVIYVPLASWLVYRSRRALLRTGIVWGVPLSLAIVGLWAFGVWKTDREHFETVLIGRELVGKIATGVDEGPAFLEGLLTAWKPAFYFLSRFLPWSIAVVWLLVQLGPRRWLRPPLGPAVLWILIVLVAFGLSPYKKALYLAPAFPAAAVLAAWWMLAHKPPAFSPRTASLIGLASAAWFAGVAYFSPRFGTCGLGDNTRAFAREAGRIVEDDDVVFLDVGYNSLQVLMGRHQGDRWPSNEQLAEAEWIVLPEPDLATDSDEGRRIMERLAAPAAEPALVSEPIANVRDKSPWKVALYPLRRQNADD